LGPEGAGVQAGTWGSINRRADDALIAQMHPSRAVKRLTNAAHLTKAIDSEQLRVPATVGGWPKGKDLTHGAIAQQKDSDLTDVRQIISVL
jgi:hypothetical protein